MDDHRFRDLVATRAGRPAAIAEAAAKRRRPTSLLGDHGRLMMIAADHPARGALAAGSRPFAMGDRVDLLDRLVLALSRPGVNGVLGTPDILEDLLLLAIVCGADRLSLKLGVELARSIHETRRDARVVLTFELDHPELLAPAAGLERARFGFAPDSVLTLAPLEKQ